MAYIGRDIDKISNVEVLDNITFDGSSSYTLQKGGSNFTPSSANTLLLSIDGVVQAGNFTVSGSTIDFGTAVAGTSTCDFILHYGVGLITTPADGSVTSAKLGGALVTPSTLDINGNELILDADADTSISADTDDQIDFKTGGTDRLTIRNDGVGIGVTASSAPLEVRTNLSSDTQSTPETVLTLATKFASTSSNGVAGSGSRLEFKIPDDETNPITGAAIAGLKENGDDSNAEAALAFYISQNDTTLDEAMRITSSGSVGIGTTSPSGSYKLSVVGGTGAVVGAFIETTSTDAGHEASIIKRPNSGVLVQFLGSGQVGSITTNGSTTTYGTSSDYRLKENIVEITDATTRLKQLKPKRFNFIADADTTVDGFIAHEVQDVVPEAIYGEKDAMKTEEYEVTPAVLDENGNVITEAVMGTREVPDYQGIDQSKLVPLLVKTIQELEARITQLENA